MSTTSAPDPRPARAHRPLLAAARLHDGARRLTGRLVARAQRDAHWREQVISDDENPIAVPTAKETRARLHTYFARSVDLEDARDGHGDRSRSYDAVRAYDHRVLAPAWDAWEKAAVDLVEALVVGGPPPWRWTLERWTRRYRYARWSLREARRRPPARPTGAVGGWDGTVIIGSSDPGGRWWPGWDDAPLAGSGGAAAWRDDDPF